MFFTGVPPSGLCLFPWSIYKVLHLSIWSNLVLWGAICYTIFSHWSCHFDTKPALSLVTLTPSLSMAPLHLYGTSLTYAFPSGRSYLWDQTSKLFKKLISPHQCTLLTDILCQQHNLLTNNIHRSRFTQFLRDFSIFF